VHHTVIGTRIVVTALAFFLLGGIEALLMRLQLSRPESHLIDRDLYNRLFTTHGSTMMFLFAVPVMQGVGTYLVPLMIGARSLAFPRLAAFSYYTFLIGGLLLYAGFFTAMAPDAGWFAYTPLSGPDFSPGKRLDVWAQLITFTEMSALATAVNLIVTVFKHRAPGMTIARIPLFVWAMLVVAFMIVFAMPSVMLASTCLALDRLVGTHFFNHTEGGDHLLWQHLFWFFAHPEVYIIFLPALGMVSAILPAFTRRRVFGYDVVVLSTAATGFVAFGVWVHHMFATGLPQLGQSYFTASSMIISIPTGLQLFCWLATMWGARLRFTTPLLYVIGFFITFIIGGLTGVMLASVPLNLQIHDTHFVVAHLHYVLIGGALFPLMGGIHYWYPKVTGRLLDERLGRASFWLLLLGFNVTFFPLHLLGLDGMPRRVYTYLASTGWGRLNLLATVGAFFLAAGFVVILVNLVRAHGKGVPAGPNPWESESLEWATASPPPPYNFVELPVVTGRSPLWEQAPGSAVVRGVALDRREMLVTTMVDAAPDHRTLVPGPSIWPLAAALVSGVTFIWGMFSPWALPLGLALSVPVLVGWFWPRGNPGAAP
jgi:cytochrome c oxidase subunit I+III